MVFNPAVKAEVPLWIAKKLAQWERFRPVVETGQGGVPIVRGLDGLQLSRHGEDKTLFTLTYAAEGFYESVTMGQLPQRHRVPKSRHRETRSEADWRDATEEETPLFKRRIDLSDAQIEEVLACWTHGKTALDLPFIGSVWRRDGKEYVRPQRAA
jgi:hypothetical protein